MSGIKIDEPSLTLVTETLFTVTPSSLTTKISPYYSCPSCIGKVIVSFVIAFQNCRQQLKKDSYKILIGKNERNPYEYCTRNF